ncbi:hypothetical protein FRC03_009412 [Tulasnella sp. 419]|nr:hypothetical protein FRC03_009412 [Tulasnella sp. 419]
MFWDASDLSELQGSTVVEKIGKEEVEANYHEKLLPLLKKRSDIFPKQYLDSYYSLTSYHIQGSRILSRSFHVEKWQENQEDVHQDQVETEAEADGQDAMEVELNHQEMEEGKDEERKMKMKMKMKRTKMQKIQQT